VLKIRPKKYHDIVLAPNLNKNYLKTSSVLSEAYASSFSISTFNKSQIHLSDTIITTQTNLNYLLGKGFYFEDSADMVFTSVDIFYKRGKISENFDIGIDAGYFLIEKKNINKYKGMRYGASLFWKNFEFRLGLNNYDNFQEVVPTIIYKNNYKKHSYSLEYTRQNAFFYTYSLCPYKDRVTANHFSASEYITFDNSGDLWANLEINLFGNGDSELTSQFDWRFYQNKLFISNFRYHLAIEGWYTSHSKQHNCFYSPKFSDATLLRVDPQYIFSKYFGIRGKLGLGHSVTDKIQPYKYGLWLFANPNTELSYSIGCLNSNAARLSTGPTYNYTECEVNLGYKW